MTPWPCSTCGADGVRNVGTDGYCSLHLADLYATFDPVVFQMNGVGMQTGQMLPEFGPHVALLECVACDAEWAGIPGAACQWCARALDRLREWTAEATLAPPDLDADDARWVGAMEAWTERLWAAVKAGLVSRPQAEAVFGRELRRVA